MNKKGCTTKIYSRVTGFYSSTDTFNPGKVGEFNERQKFDKSVKEREKEK